MRKKEVDELTSMLGAVFGDALPEPIQNELSKVHDKLKVQLAATASEVASIQEAAEMAKKVDYPYISPPSLPPGNEAMLAKKFADVAKAKFLASGVFPAPILKGSALKPKGLGYPDSPISPGEYTPFAVGPPVATTDDPRKYGPPAPTHYDEHDAAIAKLYAERKATGAWLGSNELYDTRAPAVDAFKSFDTAEQAARWTKWRSVHEFSRNAETQKVRGFGAIGTLKPYVGSDAYHVHNMAYVSAKSLIDGKSTPVSNVTLPSAMKDDPTARPREYYMPMGYPLFLRPCPVQPRHGFVDSKVVFNTYQFMDVVRKTYAADPEAEMLISPIIEAAESSVLTPTSLSVGEGNDGATSGKSNTVYGPGISADLLKLIRYEATIREPDVPYIELVGNKMKNMMVQVRGGPPIDSVTDYVPEDVTVAAILVAHKDLDLMKWEKDVANAKPGTVVYADGLSLASHFCVHAVVNKVPVITSKRPLIADFIRKTDVPVWSKYDWRRLARFLTEADRVTATLGVKRENAYLATAALHCAGTPAPATDAHLRFLAYGAVSALKCVGIACMGEARHMSRSSNEGYDPRSVRLQRDVSRTVEASNRAITDNARMLSGDAGYDEDDRYCDEEPPRPPACGREGYYRLGVKASLDSWVYIPRALSPLFNHRSWSSGYGGAAWAGINAGVGQLASGLSKFRRNPTQRSWAKLIAAWNRMIHREHNGKAPALSKFELMQHTMSAIEQFPLAALCGGLNFQLRNLIFTGPDAPMVSKGIKELKIPSRKRAVSNKRHSVNVIIVKGIVKIGTDGLSAPIVNIFARNTRVHICKIPSVDIVALLGDRNDHDCTGTMIVSAVASKRAGPSKAVLTLAKVLGVNANEALHDNMMIHSITIDGAKFDIADIKMTYTI